jgi:hypothetical protein
MIFLLTMIFLIILKISITTLMMTLSNFIKSILSLDHGPLWTSDIDNKGSTYNVLVEWETGETTYEPLVLIAQDYPVTFADYAKHNKLLATAGWKRFRCIANSDTKIEHNVNKAKLRSYQRDPF